MSDGQPDIACPRCRRTCSIHHPCEQPQCNWLQCDHCRIIIDPIRRRYYEHQKATKQP